MRKPILSICVALLAVGSVPMTSATEMTTTADTAIQTTSVKSDTGIRDLRQEFRDRLALVQQKNKELREASQAARKDFRVENSGAVRDMKKESHSGTISDTIKQAHDDRSEYIQSLSGMTLEQKALYMSGLEDRIRTEIEARFQHASGSLLAKRMEVYTANAARRAEALVNRLLLRIDRGNLKTLEIDRFIATFTTKLPDLSTEKKTKLAVKIDEKIAKAQKNTRLNETSKTEITVKLTTLRDALLKE